MFLLRIAMLVAMVTARRVVDLTHTFDKNAPKYPLQGFGDINDFNYFDETTIFENYTDYGMWIALRTYEFYEHQGTHMDAPLQFGKGLQTMSEIPPERLVGPGVVIDVRDKAKKNPNYGVTVQDILDYEEEFGRIPSGAIVMMNSDWAEKYPNLEQVFSTQNVSDSTSFNFPGYSAEACKMLLNERQVSMVGSDSPSIDPGHIGSAFLCHKYLLPNEVSLLEYVANLDLIPQIGTTIILGAIKMRTGTGGPTRILAFINDEESTSSAPLRRTTLTTVIATFLLTFCF